MTLIKMQPHNNQSSHETATHPTAHRTPFVLILIMSCYITFVGDRISQSATLFNAVDGFLQKRKINW